MKIDLKQALNLMQLTSLAAAPGNSSDPRPAARMSATQLPHPMKLQTGGATALASIESRIGAAPIASVPALATSLPYAPGVQPTKLQPGGTASLPDATGIPLADASRLLIEKTIVGEVSVPKAAHHASNTAETAEESPRKKKPVMACIYGGQGDTHRIHQKVVQEDFKKKYGDEFEIVSLDLKVSGIKRDAALQRNYDETNSDPELNEARWQEQLKTPTMQEMIKKVDKLLTAIEPDVIFSNYDTIARLAMSKLTEKYGEDRPPMIQHLSDLGVMHIRWILKEFTEKKSKDLVLTSGNAVIPGKSDQRRFAVERGVPPERIKHTGAPIRSDFNEVRGLSKQQCRDELRKPEYGINIPDDKLSILTMSGSGFWPEKFLVANEVLTNSDLIDKIHLIPIAGRLDSTKEALQEKIPPSIDILGYTAGRKLALLQRCVDLNIIKGGGGAIPEVTAVNRAFLINDALPGPEPENVNFVREQGIGLIALITKNEDGSYNTDEFMKAVREIVEHPEILEKIEEAQKAHIIEDSAEQIATILHQVGLEHFEATRKAPSQATPETPEPESAIEIEQA